MGSITPTTSAKADRFAPAENFNSYANFHPRALLLGPLAFGFSPQFEEFLQQLLLLGGEAGRGFQGHFHHQVAPGFALEARKPLPRDAEGGPGLGAGRHLPGVSGNSRWER